MGRVCVCMCVRVCVCVCVCEGSTRRLRVRDSGGNVQMWQGRAQSWGRCGRGAPNPSRYPLELTLARHVARCISHARMLHVHYRCLWDRTLGTDGVCAEERWLLAEPNTSCAAACAAYTSARVRAGDGQASFECREVPLGARARSTVRRLSCCGIRDRVCGASGPPPRAARQRLDGGELAQGAGGPGRPRDADVLVVRNE